MTNHVGVFANNILKGRKRKKKNLLDFNLDEIHFVQTQEPTVPYVQIPVCLILTATPGLSIGRQVCGQAEYR